MCDRVPHVRVIFLVAGSLCAIAGNAAGQPADVPTRNNPYSTNPTLRSSSKVPVATNPVPIDSVVAAVAARAADADPVETPAPEIATNADLPLAPTEIYKIGVGDVLIVDLKNTTNASGYYTVREDGTIDLPLVATPVPVNGKTPDEAAKLIAAGITLYSNAKVEVRIREYRSHRIKVSGLVEMAGAHSIKREAVPLYVVRAEVRVDPRATKVIVRRAETGLVATHDLRVSETENLLIYPGDSIEFTANGRTPGLANADFYYIAGAVNSAGKMEFTTGMTLFQAIIAAGGLKGDPKKASLRRKTEGGLLNLAEYDLRSIKNGKMPDPPLMPGDMIEIGN